ncbi:MAG: flagellar motor switch protein FliN [Candidatus Hydrogenedentes bacterium]|nr:flagellar motor switch protein FliN [Candidatus Hydrogenedentota bacterium]
MLNEAAAVQMAQGFLKGVFDVIDAMLGVTSSHGEPEIRAASPDELAKLSQQFPFAAHAKIKSGGGVALLLTTQDAARLASLVLSGAAEAKDTLNNDDLGSLKEIADPCLGGGVSNLKERYGVDVEMTDLQVTGAGAADLVARMEGSATVALFPYAIPPGIDGRAALLLSDSLERLTRGVSAGPGGAASAAPSPSNTQVTPSGQENTMTNLPNAAGKSDIPMPSNMDMILDIRLMATARLGRIEMPIADILALGPGSIFEVGRAVDEPIDLLVNDKLIARGDVVVVDEKFGIRITEIVSTRERIESLR